jgi:hypothetical protein
MSLIVALLVVAAIVVVASFVVWIIQQPSPPAPKQMLVYALWLVVVLVCLYVLYRGALGTNWHLP